MPLLQTMTFHVPGMHCAGCMKKLENGICELNGIRNVRANLSTRQLEVIAENASVSVEAVGKSITGLGFEWHLPSPETEASTVLKAQSRHLLLCLAVAGFAAANIMLLSVSVWSGADGATERLFALISGLIAVPTIFYAGTPFFSSAARALSARQLNMDVPISLAVLLSLFMSIYEALIGGGETFFDAGVMLLFFLLIGRVLDQLMRQRAVSGVAGLAALIPHKAQKVGSDGTIATITLNAVRPGDVLRLHAGDRFPVDAKVHSGTSTVDRSIVTGETGELTAKAGAIFEAGTVNVSGTLDVKAVSDASTSFISEVMEMMKAAETSKGRYRRIADRMAAIYAPAVHALALLTFIGWMVVTGDTKSSLVAAIAVLIITCPCALGLAVPVTHVVAANRLFAAGILMRDGSALERLAEVETVFLDKTGTLSEEKLRLRNVLKLENDDEDILHTLASQSQHPVARAISAGTTARKSVILDDIQEIPGIGLQATHLGRTIRLGRAEWACELSQQCTTNASTAFGIENGPSSALDLSSDLKPEAEKAVFELQKSGLQSIILSGDTESRVREIAKMVGVSSWFARLTPKDKIAKIKTAQNALMVGDGLNDAPSLAAAHASMAPASAIDVSRASADFVYTRASLLAVPFALRLARATSRVVRQNFGIAIVYNCIAVPLAMMGYVTPLFAALAMSLSSVVVVANSMRLAAFERGQKKSNRTVSIRSGAPSLSLT